MDRQAIRDALAKIQKYEGVTGTMQFAGSGDPIKSAVILQIKDGQFAWVANAAALELRSVEDSPRNARPRVVIRTYG